MASKLQTYFVRLINIQREIDVLKENSINGKDLMNLAGLRDKYINWLIDIREENEFKEFGTLHADNFVISDQMNNGGIGTTDRYFYVRELLRKETMLRIEFFSKLELTLKTTTKTLIKIDKEKKEVSTEKNGKNFKYAFRKGKGKNKRFDYLIMIAQNPKVGAKELSKKTYQNISSEIKKVNEKTKKELSLTKNLIINKGNSGYQINELYEINFI